MVLINKIFDNKDYTLVDNYDFNNSVIYHFTNEDDDLFCYLVNNDYQKITDESLIESLKQEYYLYLPEYLFKMRIPVQLVRIAGIKPLEEITGEERNIFINNQVEQLTDILDQNTLFSRLNSLRLFTADWNSSVAAAYHPQTNTIFMASKEDMFSNKPRLKACCLHETIHALSGRKAILYTYYNKAGLIEGATESFVEKKYGFQNSSCYHSFFNKNTNSREIVKYNFSAACSYPAQVALIRQMEYALGKESIKSILLGNNDFFKEFSNRYGKDTFRAIRHRANRLLNPEKIKDPATYMKDTQNLLLERVFDKDFETIETIDDAQKYFEKLQSFETIRGKIQGDTFFKDYYEDKLNRIKENLSQKGYSENDISSFCENHKYKEQEFLPNLRADANLAVFLLRAYINNPNIREALSNNPENIKIMTVKKDELSSYLLLSINGKPMFLDYFLGNDIHPNKLAREDSQVTFTQTDGSIDTLIQKDGHFYIKTKDGDELSFEGIDFPEAIPNPSKLIELGEKHILEKKESRKKLLESQSQTQSLKKLSSKQRLSSLSRVSEAIKRIFNKGKTQENNTEKDTTTDKETEEL